MELGRAEMVVSSGSLWHHPKSKRSVEFGFTMADALTRSAELALAVQALCSASITPARSSTARAASGGFRQHAPDIPTRRSDPRTTCGGRIPRHCPPSAPPCLLPARLWWKRRGRCPRGRSPSSTVAILRPLYGEHVAIPSLECFTPCAVPGQVIPTPVRARDGLSARRARGRGRDSHKPFARPRTALRSGRAPCAGSASAAA